MESSHAQAYAAAVRILASREHSRSELETKLLRRSFEPDHIQSALDLLVEQQYVDDARFAGLVARQYPTLGRRGLSAQMQRRGLDPKYWRDIVDAIDQDEELERARLAVAAKAREYPGDGDYEHFQQWRRRAANYMARRGFSSHVALTVIGEVVQADTGGGL